MKKTLKNERGITLIALVVTIIVLLILAGVTINAVFGENGLIKQVEIAKEKNTIASYQDEVDRALLAAKTICIAENRNGDILLEAKKELEQSTLFKDATFSEISNGEFTINTKDGYLVTVTENGVTVTKQNGVGNEKYTVQFLKTVSSNWDYGCVYSNTIEISVVKDMGYRDYMDYYLKTKSNLTAKERIAYLYYVLVNSNDDDALLKLLQQLKSENKTLSQYIEENYNTTLEEGLYTYWTKFRSEGLEAIPETIFNLVNMEKEKEITTIINRWNKSNSSNQVTTIDGVVTNMYGSEITVKALAAEYGCDEGVILDYVFLKTNSSIDEEDSKKYNALKDEYLQLGILKNIVKIKLPDGTEKQENSASYKATQNGTYEFEVTYDGKTEKYSESVTGIGHKCDTYTPDGEPSDFTVYRCNGETATEHIHSFEGAIDNGDGTHTYTCICGKTEVVNCNYDYPQMEYYNDNGDGTHSLYRSYSCTECGAIVDDHGTPEPHGNKSYVPNNDGTHSIRCGDAPGNGCGTDLGTEACTDTNGDGHCDFCRELIPTGE